MQPIEEINKRLEKLEKAVFGKGIEPPKSIGSFTGIAGGVRFLQSKSFFQKKRTASESMTELGKFGYHYPIAAVQTALNRASVKGGILTAFRENNVKVYVARK